MKLHDLDSLLRDDGQQGLYDLFAPTFADQGTSVDQHVVGLDEVMRLDLVCHRVYSTLDYADLILNVNGVINPLNIMEGDVLRYPKPQDSERYRVNPAASQPMPNRMVRPDRAALRDPRRQEMVESDYQMPPTMLPSPVSPFVVGRNEIFIKPIR